MYEVEHLTRPLRELLYFNDNQLFEYWHSTDALSLWMRKFHIIQPDRTAHRTVRFLVDNTNKACIEHEST